MEATLGRGRPRSRPFLVYPDGAEQARPLRSISNEAKMRSRVQEYGDLAASVRKRWGHIIYATVGRTPIPRWETIIIGG